MSVMSSGSPFPSILRRHGLAIALGVVVLGGGGALIVRASDNPMLRESLRDFHRPLRAAVVQHLPFQAPIQRGFQPLAYAPGLAPLPAAPAARTTLPPPQNIRVPEPQPIVAPLSPASEQAPRRLRHRVVLSSSGRMAATPTNYCVRLCDGFAFPIGDAYRGDMRVQDIACQRACPGAQTALYTAPAGAKDLDGLSRGGMPYTALPNAFRFREKVTDACSCRVVGETQSTAALLTDMTLKPGDIAMTRIGMRHFDGARRFPYRSADFSDALTSVKDKREVALIRAMEVASLRGVISVKAPAEVRARMIVDARRAERVASNETRPGNPAGLARGFSELTARDQARPIALPSAKRASGLVALN